MIHMNKMAPQMTVLIRRTTQLVRKTDILLRKQPWRVHAAARFWSTLGNCGVENASSWRSPRIRVGPPDCGIRWESTNNGNGETVLDTEDSSEDHTNVVESWISTKDRLISMEPGTLKPKHWAEAEELISALRTNPNLSDEAVPRRVEYMFDVLERLADEVVELKDKAWNENNASFPKVDQEILNQVLLTWLNFIQSKSKSSRDIMHAKNQHRRRRNMHSSFVIFSLGSLATDSIIVKVERFFQVGLFEANTTSYFIVLRGMNLVDDPQQAPHQAHNIYNGMIEKSKHDPYDTSFHPDRRIINVMVEIWAQSWLPEGCKRVEEYLMSLKGWYEQTNRPDQRPDADMYCAIMESYSRLSGSPGALKRIQELFSEMKENISLSERSVRIYNRVCRALTGCKSKEAAGAAQKLLDEMCVALMNNKGNIAPEPDTDTFSTLIVAYGQLGKVQVANSFVGKSWAGHDFNGRKTGPVHGVSHHLEKGQLLQGVGLDVHIGTGQFRLDFRNALTNKERRVAYRHWSIPS